MNDEIKEILDRLERIDHKEYSGGFEFADSTSFNEMARCFEERKIMANYITNLQQENQKSKKIIEDVYNYLDEKKDVPEWWDTDFFTCMNMLRDGKLTFNDWIKKGDDENEER